MSGGPRDRVSRRQLVLGAGVALLTGGCGTEPGADETAAAARATRQADARVLNGALAVEHLTVAAYTAAEPLLSGAAAALLEQERTQVSVLERAIRALGARPVPAGAAAGRRQLSERGDARAALRFALQLEERAVALYAVALTRLADPELRAGALALLAAEGGHAAVLRAALGAEPVPAAFVLAARGPA